MKHIIILFSIIPTLSFGQNLINQQAQNPQTNINNANYYNKLNINDDRGNEVQYMQLNINDLNDNNPIALQNENNRGGGISLPKISLPAFAWKPSAAGGGKAKKNTAAKKIFKSKKKLKKIFGKTKKIKAGAHCCKW